MIKVKYIGEDDPLSLRKGKAYNARILKKGWFGIVDETGEEYAYPPEYFKVEKIIDYIIPEDKGGTNSYSNAQVLSRQENREKWNK